MLGSWIALAQDGSAAKVCDGDINTKCAGAQPGQGQLRICINKHFGEFSEPCRSRLLQGAVIAKQCRIDVERHCKDVRPGEGRIEACLETHMGDLSKACKDNFASLVYPPRRKGVAKN